MAALFMDLLRPTLSDTKLLEQISGRSVLGVVSLSKTPEWQHRTGQDLVRFAATAGLLLAFQVGWILWIVMRSVAD
jgi:hypothetical protein